MSMTVKSAAAMILNVLFILCLFLEVSCTQSSAQSTPSYQSVSGEFAQKWIKDFKGNLSEADQRKADQNEFDQSEGNQSKESGSDLWNWGNAPRGSEIVDGKLVTDPYYLGPLLNLSSNWLDESYTDADTGLPVETYSDPFTGKKFYKLLSPNTGKPFFAYYTYLDANTGKLVYAYVDPMTGNEVYASSVPIDIIRALAGSLTDQTIYNQNDPWTQL